MAHKIGKQTVIMDDPPRVLSYASVVSKKEGEGPLKDYFDIVNDDMLFSEKSWEKAESQIQQTAVKKALEKGGFQNSDIDYIFAGDLLNQCIGSTYGIRELNISFIGLYGACSTMAESMALGSVFVDSGSANKVVAATSSHFCSSERQFRFPLEYGGQRPPSAQWTVTGAGALVLGKNSKELKRNPSVKAVCFGKIIDLGINDANNMGAAMAPDDVKIRPYPRHEGMVFFYTQIQ